MKPTDEQVQEEIKLLREMKPKVRPKTMFNEDNWAAIEAQIKVLEDGMDEDAIWDEWHNDDEQMHERESALVAMSWRDGAENSVRPSEDWQSLVQ
jgi:hypothetical protein